MIELPTLKELMEVGAHFGHKKERSYPKAKSYVYMIKDQIQVINLEKTREHLEIALKFLEEAAKEGKTILFVGTKKQAQEAIETAAKKAEMPYLSQRWLGGMLTNFETIKKRIKYLNESDARINSKEVENLTKREKGKLQEELNKLHRIFDGIVNMNRIPDVLFIIDVVKEKIAVEEARKMGMKVVGITDTNANPELIDYPIPANDDSKKAMGMIAGLIADAIREGSKGRKISQPEEKKEGEKEAMIEGKKEVKPEDTKIENVKEKIDSKDNKKEIKK